MREPIEDVIRQRVRALLAARPDVSHREFGEAIGRGYAWVHAFVTGKRHANEIHLLNKIARYFGVTVGYLLNETDRGRDAGATTLQAIYESLAERDRSLLLQLAASFRAIDAGDDTPGDDAAAGSGRRAEGADGPPRRKRR